MGEQLIRPYEISIWDTQLVVEGKKSYYKENKIAIIGSDTMTAPNRAYSPVFKKKVNGEKTLTFSIAYRYYDEEVGDFVMNPFVKYLINERIVKLKYDNKWYEFVIKECEEDSESYEFTYTATDAFIQELGKIGYNITLNTDLGNNLGTVTELAEYILKDTDWSVDKDNSDILQQKISEPIYECVVSNAGLRVLDIDNNRKVTIAENEKIWIFYSYIAHKNTKYVQFLREVDKDKWIYDDNNAIIGPNYRILSSVRYEESEGSIIIYVGTIPITVGDINMESQGYRLAYNQKTTYDPVMEKTVNEYIANYENNKLKIYQYDDFIYTSSDVVTSFVTNGTNFNIYDNGGIIGWSNANYVTGKKLHNFNLVTFPRLGIGMPLASLNDLAKTRGYLEFDFTGTKGTKGNHYVNAFFNSGFIDNAKLINDISKGNKYVFRIRYRESDEQSTDGSDLREVLPSEATIRGVVAGYDLKEKTLSDGGIIELRQVDTNRIYLNFSGTYQIGNNIIEGGYLNSSHKNYIIDSVVQEPSLKYVYKNNNDNLNYVWNPDSKKYVLYNETSYSNYLYVVAKALQSVSNKELTDADSRIGIFLYDTSDESRYVYVEEIELFKYINSGDGTPIMPGNAPVAESQKIEVFYVKPENGITKDQITTYDSLSSIAEDLGLTKDKIVSLRNENCEKVLSITEEKSNCFNLLQSLCETFECWLDIRVEHDENGTIKLDEDMKPIKTVRFKEYIGKDNFAGFKYGINLKSIKRSIDSNEFVTKLIVGQPANEHVDSGTLSITEADSNPNKESYIINLNYYVNQGLIENRQDYLSDLYNFNLKILNFNQQLENLNKSYRQAEESFTKVKSNRSVFVETQEKAIDDYTQALKEFERAVSTSYSAYLKKKDADPDILNNKTVADIIGRIYTDAAVRNNYSGIITNIKKEYNNLNILINGAETYNVVISTIERQGDQEGYTKLTLSDYIEGFECVFTDSNGEVPQTIFKSEVNKKDFTSNNIYSQMRLNSVPKNYSVEYVVNGEAVIFDDISSFALDIRDAGTTGMSKRFRLVPNKKLAKKKGYKTLIAEVEEKKQDVVNAFHSKYSRFIQEGTWESNDYVDPELYYLDAVEVSNTSAQPKLSYEIKVVEISEIEGYENYSFDVGDKTYIEDAEFFGYTVINIAGVDFKTPIQEEVVVSEVEWHLDEPRNNTIIIQNYKTQFEDLFQRISASVQSLTYNQASYNRAASIFDENGRIRPNILARSINGLAGSQTFNLIGNGVVRIVEDGILVEDLTSMANSIIIKSGGISLSTDGGLTWTKALGPEGINANVVNAGTINTDRIMIMDGKNPAFRWDKAGINAYGYSDDDTFDLTTYVRFDKYGLYGIKNGENYVCNSLEEIKDKAHFGVTWDGFFIKNNYTNGYVSISSENDFQVIRNIANQEVEKIKIGALDFNAFGNPSKYGIRIRNDKGDIVMETGDDGNLTISGRINATEGNIGGMTVDTTQLTMNSIVLQPGRGIYSTRTVIIDDGIERREEPVFSISDTQDGGTAVFNSVKARGEINATTGNFSGKVTIGKNSANEEREYIVLNGEDAIIQTSDYQDGAGSGWMINSFGDAVFNNVSVRGAVKTAVFEYEEIQAVGGAFLFRPSSTIKEATIIEDYTLTTDVTIDFTKTYYQREIEAYILTEDTEIIEGKTYYIANEAIDSYVLTSDTRIVPGKDYYERYGAGTEEDPYFFVYVEEPHAEDISTYYEKIEGEPYIPVINPVVSDLDIYYEKIWEDTGEYGEVKNPIVENLNRYYELQRSLQLIVEKPLLFREDDWCKISNYIDSEVTIEDATGLAYICKIESIDEDGVITLVDIDKELSAQVSNMPGGALISFGKVDNSNNYGIGINSSDNFVNLPRRSISLFDSIIQPNRSIKVRYDYHGILGTLPELSYQGSTAKVSELYHKYLKDTQGIFTDNMYIGDANQYVTFYTDKDDDNKKKLKIRADSIEFSPPDGGDYIDVSDGNIDVSITSNKGEIFKEVENVVLTCTVLQYGRDITDKVVTFQWKKDGYPVVGETDRTLEITTDFTSTVVYTCDVTLN